MGRKYNKIVIPLYNHIVYVFYSLDDYTGTDYPDEALACTWDILPGSHCTTIVFKKWSIELAAHEATHAIFAMLNHIGLPVTHEGQEAVAYPLGYLVSEIVKGKEKWDAKQTA